MRRSVVRRLPDAGTMLLCCTALETDAMPRQNSAQTADSTSSPVGAIGVEQATTVGGRINAIIELTKPGIVRMVLVATAIGFALGAIGHNWATTPLLGTFLICMLGTAFSASGANALNQAFEVSRDARMPRTADRPIPSGRVSVETGWAVGMILSVLGVGILALGVNWAAAAVSAATIVSYVLWYTPLKPMTPLSTLVGAIPGAFPPLLGWAAATPHPLGGLNEPGGWSLFAIMFVWQVPHVMAISWKYRHEYADGGYRVLPSIDPSGVKTGATAVMWSAALIPVSMTPLGALDAHETQSLGLLYAVVAVVAGLGMLWASIGLYRHRTDRSALVLFIVSIIYLPVLFAAMAADAFALPLIRGLF